MCLSVGKSENAFTGNAAFCAVNVPFYLNFMLAFGLLTFHFQEKRTVANDAFNENEFLSDAECE